MVQGTMPAVLATEEMPAAAVMVEVTGEEAVAAMEVAADMASLTGRQVYEACQLTGRSTAVVAKLSGVAYATLVACRDSDEALPIDFMGTANVRRVLCDLGVEFYIREDGRPSVRMREGFSALGSWRKG